MSEACSLKRRDFARCSAGEMSLQSAVYASSGPRIHSSTLAHPLRCNSDPCPSPHSAQEQKRQAAIVSDASFRANPFAALRAHARQSLAFDAGKAAR